MVYVHHVWLSMTRDTKDGSDLSMSGKLSCLVVILQDIELYLFLLNEKVYKQGLLT